MILVRQVFQIKYGHMDEVLTALQAVNESDRGSAHISRILTDISGQNFTLVFESKADSLDAYWEALQASFGESELSKQMNEITQYIESGRKDFYTIEYEAEG